jgi:hypothetical protein
MLSTTLRAAMEFSGKGRTRQQKNRKNTFPDRSKIGKRPHGRHVDSKTENSKLEKCDALFGTSISRILL